MIEPGRDRSGDEHSPPSAATLGRTPPVTGSFFPIGGIRENDRTTTGANPVHDQNLQLILYALTELTEEKNLTRADHFARLVGWIFYDQARAEGLTGAHPGD